MAVHIETTNTQVTAPWCLVVDTNVVLDLWVFRDGGTDSVAAAAADLRWNWLGSPAMRDELQRVLSYALIAAQLDLNRATVAQVLERYDGCVRRVHAPPRCSAICKDPDDQKFIDLAVQHRAVLLSKDKAVLALKRKLAVLGVSAIKPHEFQG